MRRGARLRVSVRLRRHRVIVAANRTPWLPIDGVSRWHFRPPRATREQASADLLADLARLESLRESRRRARAQGEWRWRRSDGSVFVRWVGNQPRSDEDDATRTRDTLDECILRALAAPRTPADLGSLVRADFGGVTERSLRRAVSRLVDDGQVVALTGGERPEYVRAGTICARNGYEPDGGMWAISRRHESSRVVTPVEEPDSSASPSSLSLSPVDLTGHSGPQTDDIQAHPGSEQGGLTVLFVTQLELFGNCQL